MATTITTPRTGRTWYGRPTYAIRFEDPTGHITFHGYSARAAAKAARILTPIVGTRPIGALADEVARVMGLNPEVNKEWGGLI